MPPLGYEGSSSESMAEKGLCNEDESVDIAPEEKERPLLPRERAETISDSEARSRPWSSSRHKVAFEKWKTPDDPPSPAWN